MVGRAGSGRRSAALLDRRLGLARTRPTLMKAGLAAAVAAVLGIAVTISVLARFTDRDAALANAFAAARVNQGATPTATASGQSVTVSWAATTLTSGDAVSGYLVKRYDAVSPFTAQTILSACTGTITGLTCTESSVPAGSWKYSVTPVFGASWQGLESARSTTVVVGANAPVNSISLSGVSGGATKTGDNVYYAGAAGGSFTLTNAVSATDASPASSATASLGGTSTGWTHTPSTVSTPSGGPYVSNSFTWAAGTTSAPTETVTGWDTNGGSAATTLTFVNDDTAPTTGTISYLDAVISSSTVSVSFTTGTDAGSGIGTRLLQRASATFNGSTCATFGSFTTVTNGTNPTSPFTDTISGGNCYQYRYLVYDGVGNAATPATSANIVRVNSYTALVSATSGLVNYYRLGEAAAGTGTVSSDNFTGAGNTDLTAHTGEVGATWAQLSVTGATNEQLSDNNRARRNGSGIAIMYTTTAPASANYAVSADLYRVSALSGDRVGVLARMDAAGKDFYLARWEEANQGWFITKYDSGGISTLGSLTGQTLTLGATYNLRFEVSGSNPTYLNLYINGVLKVSATDSTSPFTATGYGGIIDGHASGSSNKADNAGIHVDNFRVLNPAVTDSAGTNHGYYYGGPTAGVAGGIRDDANTAVTFDGVDDCVNVARQISDNLSIEFWFKSTQGIGTGTAWTQGAGMVDADTTGTANDFGVSLRSDGKVVAGVGGGGGDTSIVSSVSGTNDGGWHYVVLTRTKGTGEFTLYVDGVSAGTATNNTASLTATAYLNFGRLASGGNGFAGTLDEVALYDVALDPATITAHYDAGH